MKKRKTLATPQNDEDHNAFAAELEERLRAEAAAAERKYIVRSSFK
jgi:hypothetical protein